MTALKKIFKWTLIITGVGLLLFFGYLVYVSMAFSGALDSFHTRQGLAGAPFADYE
jgi:hypothetical protein